MKLKNRSLRMGNLWHDPFDPILMLFFCLRTELKVIQETRWPKFMQPLRFVKPTSSCSAIPIRFVAKLNTPLAASDAIVQKLMESTSLIKGKPGPMVY